MKDVSSSALACDIREAAALVGVSRSRLYLEIKAGRLPIRKAGKRSIVEVSALRAWLAALPHAVAPAQAKGGRA